MSKKIKTEAAKRLFQAVLTLETEEECFTFFEDLLFFSRIFGLFLTLKVRNKLFLTRKN